MHYISGDKKDAAAQIAECPFEKLICHGKCSYNLSITKVISLGVSQPLQAERPAKDSRMDEEFRRSSARLLQGMK